MRTYSHPCATPNRCPDLTDSRKAPPSNTFKTAFIIDRKHVGITTAVINSVDTLRRYGDRASGAATNGRRVSDRIL